MHRLHKAAQQAQPQQKAGEGQQPGRTGGQPPRRQPGQKVDLRKGQLIAVRALLRLPDGQQKERQRGKAVGSQQPQRRPLAAFGPVQAGGLDGEQLVGQMLRIGPAEAEGQGALFRFAHGIERHPAGPGQPVIKRPFDGQCCQRSAPHRPVEPEQELPVEAEGAAFIQRPAACVEDDPAQRTDQQKEDEILPERCPQRRPVVLKQHTEERHQIEHQRFAEDPQGGKGV